MDRVHFLEGTTFTAVYRQADQSMHQTECIFWKMPGSPLPATGGVSRQHNRYGCTHLDCFYQKDSTFLKKICRILCYIRRSKHSRCLRHCNYIAMSSASSNPTTRDHYDRTLRLFLRQLARAGPDSVVLHYDGPAGGLAVWKWCVQLLAVQ